MQPVDIGRLTAVGDPRLSPDGSTVAFSVATIDLDANEYRSRVWLASVDGSSEPRPFTSGEHGGDPESIALFAEVGLHYVSCSPFRVPIARLAAAQAVLGAGAVSTA